MTQPTIHYCPFCGQRDPQIIPGGDLSKERLARCRGCGAFAVSLIETHGEPGGDTGGQKTDVPQKTK